MTQSIPEHKGLPFIGAARDLIADAPGFTTRLADTCGPVVRFGAFGNQFLLLSDPDLIREVLVTQAAAFPKDDRDVAILARMLGYGLLSTNGDTHKRQRRLTQPAFHTRRIEAYATTMVDYTNIMIDEWQLTDTPGGRPLDISVAMSELTMYIVAQTLFGTDRTAMQGAAQPVGQAIEVLQDTINREYQAPFIWPGWLPTAHNRRRRAAAATLTATITDLIARRRTAANGGRVVDHGDLLSMLLLGQDEAGDGLSDAEVQAQLLTLFVAGHETTSNALTWTWYLLSQHPAAEAQLHAEVDRVLGGRPPVVADLPALPYTLRVIKEALRLYPPAWTLNIRRAAADTTLGPYAIRCGELVWISPYVVHRRAGLFPDPERFDPDRWLPEREAALPKYAWLPFGAGPRVCIGNNFAMMEAQLIVATMAGRTALRLAPDQVIALNPQVTLSNRGGMRMVAASRAAGAGG